MTVLRGLPLVGIAAALIAVAIWGGNFIVARGLADHIPPVALAFFRWMLGLAVLLPFAIGPIWRQRRLILSDWRMLTLTAFIGITVFNTLIYFAGATTTAIKMALIAGLTPAIIILSDRVMFGTPLTGRKLIGLAVAFSGVAYLVTGGNFASILRDGVTAGDLLMLAAATCFALYSNLLKYRPAAMDSTAHLGVLFAIGLVLLFPAYLWEMGMGRVVVWDRENLQYFMDFKPSASDIRYLLH